MAQLEQGPGAQIPSVDAARLPFPASTRQAAGMVAGIMTDVMCVSFADKILFTITQSGRLAHWLHVPLEDTNPTTEATTFAEAGDESLLPSARLTATPLLGGRSEEWEAVGHLYACQVANAILTKDPTEKRLLVVGLGLDQPTEERDVFFGIIDLVLRCV